MKRYRGILLAFALASGVVPLAMAADPLAQVRSQMAQVPVLRGDFTQEKQVAGFKNPLRSNGRFLLARHKGVVWTTTAPFPSEIVITASGDARRDR